MKLSQMLLNGLKTIKLMAKFNLSVRVAKLMIEKLNEHQLERELKELLILLPSKDLEHQENWLKKL